MRTTTITHGRRTTEVHYFETRFFEVDGRQFEIVGTESTGQGAMDSIHQVKGTTETKAMKHKTLVKLYQAGRLKAVMP
jgi:hypothetical protein